MFKNLFGNKGILGINARNLHYLKPYNPKKAIKLADDKIKTKQFLSARGIPVPKLFQIIKNTKELEKFNFSSLPSSFVLKPNKGYGGEGIIVIEKKKANNFITPGGKTITTKELKSHIYDILDGRFSLSGLKDTAFFEQRIISDERIGKYSYKGLPDIRVIVHNLIPVVAMLRLASKKSDGKANLHQGAIGVGIDIAKGKTTHIAQNNKILDTLPEELEGLKGLQIPYWDDILLIASKAQLITNLGYLSADICIDKNTGPVLIEINARGGLKVQIANLVPLRKRLQRIEGVKVPTPTKGVRIAKDMFGNVVEKEIQNLSGKEVINTSENIFIIKKTEKFKLKAKINTNQTRSIIDEKFASKHGLLDDIKNFDEEMSTLKVKFNLKGKRIQTIADVEHIKSKTIKFKIGTRDLDGFLIDPSKKQKKPEKLNNPNSKKINVLSSKDNQNYNDIDNELYDIDKKLNPIYHLKPLNYEEEKKKFLNKEIKNPIFKYPELKFDPIELISRLEQLKIDSSLIGLLFQELKEELINKINLISTIGEKDFSYYSKKLYDSPSENEVKEAYEVLKKHKPIKNYGKLIYTTLDVKKEFEKVLDSYGLKNWNIKIKENMLTSCVAGKRNTILLKDTMFSKVKIKNLIVHEIETHLLTAENGKSQPYNIFSRGLSNYLSTQEGLAIYNQEICGLKKFDTHYRIFAYIVAIHLAEKHSFYDVFHELKKFNLSNKAAFTTTLKIKRGLTDTSEKGAFTKNYLYYRGYKEVKAYLESGGDYKDLYLGKLNIKDLNIIKRIENIKNPKYLPKWFKQ